jgi:hypothetical protein
MSLSVGELLQGNYCVYEVSKDLTGQVTVLDADYRGCSSPSCSPLVQQEFLRLDAASNPHCDSNPLGMVLDGVVRVRYFVTVFTGPRENLRGVHAGQFDWTPIVGGRIAGTLEGISNAGVLRPKHFDDCERCDVAGIVSGHLFGTGNGVPGVPVPDFQVDAVYRLAWDPLAWDPSNPNPLTAPVRGTLEGVLIIACQ